MRRKIFFWIIYLILVSNSFGKIDISFNGYYKSFMSVFCLPEEMSEMFGINKSIGAVSNNIRLRAMINFNSHISLEAAYNINPTVKSPVLFSSSIFPDTNIDSAYRLTDIDDLLYPTKPDKNTNFGIYQNIDRLFLSVQTDFADISIGRQPISWGSARFINPTDILSPFTYNELDKEEKRGIDAIRIRMPIGDMGELDFGCVINEDMKIKTNAVFIRGKTQLFDSDISVSLIKFYQNMMIGADISGSIGGAGFWIEGAYVLSSVFGNSFINEKEVKLKDYFRLSAGFEYNFSDKLYAFTEYHFNSLGENTPANYLSITHTQEFKEGAMYLAGKHYLNIGITYTVSPLIPLNGIIIYNLKDNSFILSPSMDYNIAQNIYVAVGGYFAIGKRASVLPNLLQNAQKSPLIIPSSEFGFSPTILYSSFRIYF